MTHTVILTRTVEGEVLVAVRPNTVPLSFPTTRLRFNGVVDLSDLAAPLFRAGFRLSSGWSAIVSNNGLHLEASATTLAPAELARAQVFSGATS